MALFNRSRVLVQRLQVGRSITRTLADRKIMLDPQQPEKCVETEQTNGVRRILLSQTSKRNTLSLKMMHTILQIVKAGSLDPDLRSIVITHEPGTVFSAGHDLKDLISDMGERHHHAIFQSCNQLMKAMSECTVPIIAAVDGLAAAAGCQLVATCDIVVCTERSSFSTPGVNFGIFCSTPGVPLIRSVPKKVATHMLYTGLPITATEAYQAGLVSKIVPVDKLEAEVDKITDAINTKSRPVIRLGKQFIEEQVSVDIETAYGLGIETVINNLKLKDAQEGIISFVEKRKPKWTHS